MYERVHPGGESADHPAAAPSSPSKQPPASPEEEKSQPAPGTYVIQVPKEQIYRVPSPETAQRFDEYTRRRRRRSCCCCCLAWTAAVSLALVLALAVTTGVLYLVFRPKLPHYSIESLAVKGFNLTSRLALSPEFDVTVRAENPNRRIGIYYRGGGSVVVSHSGVNLCGGAWPAFYHGPRNATVVKAALKGSGVRLAGATRSALAVEQGRGTVPLEIGATVPVRVKVGAVTTWTVTVKVRCEVTVDGLTATASIVSKSCAAKVKI